MLVEISISSNRRYLQVIHTGSHKPDIAVAELSSEERVVAAVNHNKSENPELENIPLALVDFTKADFDKVNLMMVDDVASSIKLLLPKLAGMAIVKPNGVQEFYFEHAKNVCFIRGIDTKLFTDISDAKDWLLAIQARASRSLL